jgi:hypothetical protein
MTTIRKIRNNFYTPLFSTFDMLLLSLAVPASVSLLISLALRP